MEAERARFRSSKWAAREYGIDEELARELVSVNVEVEENIRERSKDAEDMVTQVKIIPKELNVPGIGNTYLATIKWWERVLGFSVPIEKEEDGKPVYEFKHKWNEYGHLPIEVQRLIVMGFLEGRSQVNIAFELSILGITLYQVKHILLKHKIPTNRKFQPSENSLQILLKLWRPGKLPRKLPQQIEDYITDYLDLGSYELVAEKNGVTKGYVKQVMKKAWDFGVIEEYGDFNPNLVEKLNLG